MLGRTAVVICALLAASPLGGADEGGAIRESMASVFTSMRVLLELSATPGALADPANEGAVLDAAHNLADQADLLARHAARDDVGFLATTLGRYALWLRRSVEWRDDRRAASLLRQTVDVCIACHTRLPSRHDSPLAEDFLSRQAMSALPARERAKLAVATRRFDTAVHTLETLLAAEPRAPDWRDLVRRYLVVTLRVKGDPARAERTLIALAGDAGLPAERRGRVRDWADELGRFASSLPAPDELETARALIREGEARRVAERADPLVHYVAASRLLDASLTPGVGSAEERAEALYLRGLAEYRTEDDALLPQVELYLEMAIHTAPASPHARHALALLREKFDRAFTRRGAAVPSEVLRHLDLLERLVERDR